MARGPGGRIIDITVGIDTGMPVWPGDPVVVVSPAALVADGEPANVSELRLGTHTGTHVDPPAHLLDGSATVDELDLEALVGPATVVDLCGTAGPIGPAELDAAGLPPTAPRVLLKTDNSATWARRPRRMPDHPVVVSVEGAEWLLRRGVRLVGADSLSIEAAVESDAGAPSYPVHELLLGAGVVLVEGLDLSGAVAGDHLLACLPLKIVGGDGAPARAVLLPSSPASPE